MRTIVLAAFLVGAASVAPAAAQDRVAAQRSVTDLMRGRAGVAPAAAAESTDGIVLPWSEATAISELTRALGAVGVTTEIRGEHSLVATDSTGSATFSVGRRDGRMALRRVFGAASLEATVLKIVLMERRRTREG